MPAKPLTHEQLEDASRLRKVFEQKKKTLGLTQEALAAAIGWSQGAVYQYMSGKIPLNYEALLKFCEHLQVPAKDISPTMAQNMGRAVPSTNDPELNKIGRVLEELDGPGRQVVLRAAMSVAEAYHTKHDDAPERVD